MRTKRAAAESAAARVLREQLREREESAPRTTASRPPPPLRRTRWRRACGVCLHSGHGDGGRAAPPPRAVASSWRSHARGGARHAATDVDTVDPFLGLRDRIEDIFNNEITRSASFKST